MTKQSQCPDPVPSPAELRAPKQPRSAAEIDQDIVVERRSI